MIKKTILQTFVLLRQNPLRSTISILGTAIAITMIMAIVITWQTKYSDTEPEVNRSRCRYFSAMHLSGKGENKRQAYGASSALFMKECVAPLPEVEACTAFNPATAALVSLSDGSQRAKVDMVKTDPGFWKVFRFRFIVGRSFDEGDQGGETKAVVMAASVARRLFGTTDAVGKGLLLNREKARVCGVVKDVSVTAKNAYAQVWCMYPADELNGLEEWRYTTDKTVVALLRPDADEASFRQGVEKRVKDVNAGLQAWQIDIMDQPDNIVAHVNHVWMNVGPDLTMLYLQYAIALCVILLVPSINLCGLSHSHMQQRYAELGVRKAFGATRGALMRQVLEENLILTLLGGFIGLLVSYGAVYALRTWLFTNSSNVTTSGDFTLSMSVLFSPAVFGLAFLFCLVINLLSAGFPAWIATRRNIVDSLNNKI